MVEGLLHFVDEVGVVVPVERWRAVRGLMGVAVRGCAVWRWLEMLVVGMELLGGVIRGRAGRWLEVLTLKLPLGPKLILWSPRPLPRLPSIAR